MNNHFEIKEGDIVGFYYSDAKKNKFAVNVEVLKIRKNNITGAVMTSKRIDCLYPGDYLLPEGIMPKPTKIICDQIVNIKKKSIYKIYSNVGPKILQEIRKKIIKSLMNIDIDL